MLDYYSKSRPKEMQDMVVRLAYLAEIKEWDCRPHIERIRRYASVIGGGLEIGSQDNELLAMAAQLHDIGKGLMPDDLLHKGGKFTADERVIIERHTTDGAKILENSGSPLLQIAARIAVTHHERWDGTGYPNHLKGDEIPLGGRICAIADVFDALTTARTYKETISMDEALKLIYESGGVLFDPLLVKVFSDHFDEIKKITLTIKD